jgi:hypothetical protein
LQRLLQRSEVSVASGSAELLLAPQQAANFSVKIGGGWLLDSGPRSGLHKNLKGTTIQS